jgi:ferredoxin-NADP reductase
MFLFVTRMRDTAFKRVLETMAIGSQDKIESSFGNLVLHHDRARDAAFLAGGVGITSLRSMLLRATREPLPPRLVLAYSNRRPEDVS